ncbi:hypothetical protein THTE_0118 [Thermogutta terrifontis]|uniref:Uncharacterized protein n=1 Tax=Thermogutta terrifontis TaxID=1331910 RepID=A0A286R9U6_9BACT|nr:hypothetical protein THTE_0118 [Thermogutta terrifontis]
MLPNIQITSIQGCSQTHGFSRSSEEQLSYQRCGHFLKNGKITDCWIVFGKIR